MPVGGSDARKDPTEQRDGGGGGGHVAADVREQHRERRLPRREVDLLGGC